MISKAKRYRSFEGRQRRGLRVESLEPRQLLAAHLISGYVYNDANHNGLFDAGESPLAGSTIALVNSAGAIVGSQTTGPDGRYQFSVDQTVVPAPATLTRTFNLPSTLTPTLRTATIPQFDPSLGTLTSVDLVNTLNLADRVRVENFNNNPATLTAITGAFQRVDGPFVTDLTAGIGESAVFAASGYDGVADFAGTSGRDFGPRTVGTVKSITLTEPAALFGFIGTSALNFQVASAGEASVSGSGNVIQSITTEAGGSVSVVYHYTPTATIVPGNYLIVQTNEPPGFFDGTDSKAGVPIPNSIGTDVIPVTVIDADAPANNFGESAIPNPPPPSPPPGLLSSLSGFVFLDINNDGIKQPSEFGIAHIAVTLSGTNNQGQFISQTTTSANDGSYSFPGLLAGNYTLTESAVPFFIDGKDSVGTQGGVATTGRISSIALAGGVNGVSNNFGELLTPACQVVPLLRFHTQPGHQLPLSQIGPFVRFFLPTLVPLMSKSALVAAPRIGRH